MNDKIRKHLIAYNKTNGYSTEDWGLKETVTEGFPIKEEHAGASRWWDEWYNIVEVGGMLLGYYSATSSGDMSAEERGYEFDFDAIHEVEKVEETVVVTKYVKKED